MYEFKLPDLGEGIHEGEILKWHVSAGQAVAEDGPLVDVETDKAAVTIPSPRAGVVVRLMGKAGDIIQVGQVLAAIDDAGKGPSPAPVPGREPARTPAAEPKAAEPPARPEQIPMAARAGPVPAAPATRRLARELGVDLANVPPTGPAGRVMADDVRAFAEGRQPPSRVEAEAAAAAPPVDEERLAVTAFGAHAASAIPFLDIKPLPDFGQWGRVEKEPLRSIRRKVAHKMVTSMVLIPHVAHMDDADVTLLEEFRERERGKLEGKPGGRLTLLAFVVKAVTAGLQAAPVFNASLDPFNEEIIFKKYYNIGIAVDSGRGLVVPVIRDTALKSILQISAAIEDLAARARKGEVKVDELQGGTFTITNVGPLGGTALIPTINYPEAAILGMGKVQEKPVVRDGKVVIRKILPLTLAFDHRIADGADAARFVTELARQLSDPNLLLLET